MRIPSTPCCWKLPFIWSCLLILPGLPLSAAPTTVTGITVGPTTVTLTFQNDGSSNQFTLRKGLGLGPGQWSNAANATLTTLGGGKYSFVVPRPSADREFYQIISSLIVGTALDPDGDGLPSELENSFASDPNSPLYSNPNLFDTDGDGFSDGIEFALGTEPNNPNSFPSLAALPAVEFAEPLSSAIEGNSPHLIPLTAPSGFSGTVHYTVNSRSTATSPTAFAPLSGSVTLSGGAGTISLSLVDDLIISPERLILIDLTINPPGKQYRPSGTVTHVVNLSDNDGYWSGALLDEAMDAARDFRLQILRNASTTEVAFVSGNSDGLPVPDAGNSSQSTGLIPDTNLAGASQQVFPAISPLLTLTRFTASTPAIPAVTGCVFKGVPLKRTIVLDANSALNASHVVNRQTIAGGFVESITHATDPTVTYLDTTVSGTFVITRDIATPPNLPSAFLPP